MVKLRIFGAQLTWEPIAISTGGPNGSIEDITPSAFPDVQRRLFLPDDAAVYNFEDEGVLKPNVRLALCDDPLIDGFFAAAQDHEDILNSIPSVNVGSNCQMLWI